MYVSYSEKQDWYLKLIQHGVQGHAATVGFVISTFVNGTDDPAKRGLAWPTREQILERMNRPINKSNLNQISKWVKILEKSGWIITTTTPIPEGGKKNWYRLSDGGIDLNPLLDTTKPTNSYPEAHYLLPPNPLLVGDKSKVKINIKEKEEVKANIINEVKDNKDGDAGKPAQTESSTLEQDNHNDDILLDFPKGNEILDSIENNETTIISNNDEELNPKPTKSGFGTEEDYFIKVRGEVRRLILDHARSNNERVADVKMARAMGEAMTAVRNGEFEGTWEEVAVQAARKSGMLQSTVFTW